MKLGIIGFGVVGQAIASTFELYLDIIKYDKFNFIDDFQSLSHCKIIFISVPTPFDYKAKKVDLSAVEESVDKLKDIKFNGTIILKSTVPPGTTTYLSDKYGLDIVFNPEFLRESTTPNEDFRNQDCIVVGSNNGKSYNKVKELYNSADFTSAEYFHVSFEEAEMIKYCQNTMLASRVALANVIYDSCQDYNIDYNKIKKIAFDRFDIIGPYMSQVPGPDSKRGFGGKCLPKDILGFSTINDSKIIQEIINYNESLRDDLSMVLDNFKEKK